MTQLELAKQLGVSAPFISQFRSGIRSFSKKRARRISNDTGISLEVLAFENGERPYQMLLKAYGGEK